MVLTWKNAYPATDARLNGKPVTIESVILDDDRSDGIYAYVTLKSGRKLRGLCRYESHTVGADTHHTVVFDE